MGPPIDHMGQLKLGSENGCFSIPKNELKLKVSPRVLLHDDLKTGLNVRCVNQWESNVGPHILGSERSL